MNNLYHKFTVASVGIALGLALGANKEARAATLTFTSTRSFYVIDNNKDGVVDYGSDYPGERYTGLRLSQDYTEKLGEYRSFYQFNIANLFLDPNIRIKDAFFQFRANGAQYFTRNTNLEVYGYTEDHQLFDNGEYVSSIDFRYFAESRDPNRSAIFRVLTFIKRTENNDSFLLSIRPDKDAFVILPEKTNLTIITEPVPEPTTFFGSAIGLCLGGWLKRRKSDHQNKTISQN
jgi:hypothetical protein